MRRAPSPGAERHPLPQRRPHLARGRAVLALEGAGEGNEEGSYEERLARLPVPLPLSCGRGEVRVTCGRGLG